MVVKTTAAVIAFLAQDSMSYNRRSLNGNDLLVMSVSVITIATAGAIAIVIAIAGAAGGNGLRKEHFTDKLDCEICRIRTLRICTK